ncbi:sensor histidine kinase [Ectobacillus funiculus]|uniref:sensor histidine kinase n=1 Tax=Ectobacillus funiculus TaxID=137993 RepID=UPI00397A70F7
MKQRFQKRLLRFKNEKIRYKYFTFLIGLTIPPLFLLGFLSYNIAKDALLQNQMETTQNHLQTSSEVADLLFRNVINMERLISWNKDVHQQLKESAQAQGDEQNVLGESTTKRIQNLIASYLIDTQDIDSICLFDVKNHSVCYGNSNSTGIYGTGGVHGEISLNDWYQKSAKANGKAVFFGYNVLTGSGFGSTFSSVKLLKDPEQLFNPETTGLLVINIKKSMFSRVFKESEDSSFVVLDASNDKVQAIYNYPPSFEIEDSLGKSTTETFAKLQKKGYLVSSDINQTTGWTFAQVTKENELLKQSNRIGIVTAFISLFIALISLFFSFMISGTIARPLLQLRNMAMDWTRNLWNSNEEPHSDDIGVIGRTFERITVENKELNERLISAQLKEREAELRALQAQIKPHFLYNTLDSMYWMAILQNNHDLAKMAVALSQSFKLSLNNGKDMILVSQELEHIQHYMTIQNMRYHNRFQYIEDVDPSLMNKEMLKLLLQPLVENAIYHGLEPKVGEGSIHVTGRNEDGWIVFTVKDDGVGIEDMNAIEQGYGLRNVRERLQLCYGNDSELNISSVVDEGTSVEIRFREDAKGE